MKTLLNYKRVNVPSPLGLRAQSLSLIEAHMLEAGLPGLWNLRSLSLLFTDAHNNAHNIISK